MEKLTLTGCNEGKKGQMEIVGNLPNEFVKTVTGRNCRGVNCCLKVQRLGICGAF